MSPKPSSTSNMSFIQPRLRPLPPSTSCQGLTVLVTGATAGLGYEASRQFLTLGASTLILAVRNPSKGATARSSLQPSNPKATIKVMQLDTNSYDSVVAFCDALKREVSELHIALLNAGIGQIYFELSPTGHEKVTQVNYLSNTLLSLELLPLLTATARRAGSPSRLSWVGSRMHHPNSLYKKSPIAPGGSVLAHFDDKKNYHAVAHYGDTKLLGVMFITELAKRVKRQDVVINSMCPGQVLTDMGEGLPIYFRVIHNAVAKIRARKVEEGGWVLVNAALVAGEETHGGFLEDMELSGGPTPYLQTKAGKDTQKKCWDETRAEMIRVDPRVKDVVVA